MSTTEEPKKESAPLMASSLQEGEYQRTVYVARIPRGVRLEDVLVPSFWAHTAPKLKPYDKIELRAEDGTWYGEVIVMDSSRTWARVKPLVGPVFFTTADVSESQAAETNFEVLHRGPKKWSVIDKKNRKVYFEGGALREDAETWIKTEGQKVLAAAPA